MYELFDLDDLLAVGADLHVAAIEVEAATTELLKFCLQARDLILELSDHGVFRVLIDTGLVLNVLRATGVS